MDEYFKWSSFIPHALQYFNELEISSQSLKISNCVKLGWNIYLDSLLADNYISFGNILIMLLVLWQVL